MKFLKVLALLWAFFLSMAAFVGGGMKGFGVAFPILLVGWAPFGLLKLIDMMIAAGRASSHCNFMHVAGIEPGSGWDHSEGPSGIAIDARAKKLLVHENGFHRVYGYGDVRSWESNKQTAGVMAAVGGGLAGAMAAGGASMRAESQAEAATGFYVFVRDIEHPRWRVAMSSARDQARWMEIFTQELNERES